MAPTRTALPELREEDASPAIRRLYAEIKRASGTPLVNLIFRHLATIPGGLEWVWGSIDAIWGYDGLLKAAQRMPVADIVIVVPRTLWRAANVSDADLVAIRALIADYNATNAANILAATALSIVLRTPGSTGGAPVSPPTASPSDDPTRVNGPAVPRMDSLTDDVRDLVLFANQIGEAAPPAMVASMYRHLALWPGSLAIAVTMLTTLAPSGCLQQLQDEVIVQAEALAVDLVAQGANRFPPLVEPASRDAIATALDLFRTTLIAKMLPVGHILTRALTS